MLRLRVGGACSPRALSGEDCARGNALNAECSDEAGIPCSTSVCGSRNLGGEKGAKFSGKDTVIEGGGMSVGG